MPESTDAGQNVRRPRQTLWEAALASLTGRVPEPELGALAASVAFVEEQPGTLRAAIPASRLRVWLRDGHLPLLAAAVRGATDGACALSLAPIPDDEWVPTSGLDPSDSLNRFIASPSNEFACAAVELVAESPGKHYSPLYIHGPPGSGKSHLLRGIAAATRARFEAERVHCLGAEAFSLELVSAIWEDQLSAFRARYRGCAGLLIDDVDALINREATQEEAVHTLDALAKEQVQVVVTSRHPPEAIPGLSPTLSRRLSAGLVVRVLPPEWETRIAILMDRARIWDTPLSPEVASFLVARAGTDLTQLDALLTRALTDPACGPALTDLGRVRLALTQAPAGIQKPRPDLVIRHVARHYQVRVRDFRARVRSQRVTAARQIAIHLIRRHCELSYPEIGRLLNRHHTTALHACRAIAGRLEADETLRAQVREIERTLLRDPDAQSLSWQEPGG